MERAGRNANSGPILFYGGEFLKRCLSSGTAAVAFLLLMEKHAVIFPFSILNPFIHACITSYEMREKERYYACI
jgi:hypothetical protein